MNHDYAHYFDFTEECPEGCFRAQLERDLSRREGEGERLCVYYMHLKGTPECEIVKGES